MVKQPVRLRTPDKGLSLSELRVDLGRETSIIVQRNVNGHVYVTLGKNEATLIIHPRAASRLVANITGVLDGKEFTHD